MQKRRDAIPLVAEQPTSPHEGGVPGGAAEGGIEHEWAERYPVQTGADRENAPHRGEESPAQHGRPVMAVEPRPGLVEVRLVEAGPMPVSPDQGAQAGAVIRRQGVSVK